MRNTGHMNKKAVVLLAVFLLAGCGPAQIRETAEEVSSSRADTGFVVTSADSYDSADTAILIKKDKEKSTVQFLNLNKNRYYTLSYDGTTHLYDKYGESISMDQIREGDIVDVTFLKDKKHLTCMQLSSKAWKNENVSRYEINGIRKDVTIGQDVFKLGDETRYFSFGQQIEEMDLNASDVLNFQGIDNKILSVSVAKGHGYLRLVNDENFVGGWIEIGQTLVQKITEDMLLTVPEGSYQVTISYKGGGGVKNVVINRNEEIALDIGDLEVAEVQTGMLLFSVNPSEATVYLDGTQTDVSDPVTLEYGLHQMIVKAPGYKSITQYIRVGQPSAGINVELESASEKKEDTKKEDTGKDSTAASYKVYVDAPEQAEVYLDGNYVGVVPCSFKKESGAHVITLRRTGYTTRSYTVQIDTEEKDISYSFAELVSSQVSDQEEQTE